jgi:phenylpropionate dioxygenase-like ring-hydroxylating dioxygenase large terminal subunit
MQDGFPYKAYPSGWFQIAWSGELAPGDVRPLHYFGRDLVLYRGKLGEFHVLDAHCRHMGAHLGYGGRVIGDSIICPFHGWRWQSDGQNEMVPSEKRRTDRCRIRAWRTVVANGIVWLWFDAQGSDPFFEAPVDLPGVADGRRYDVYPHCAKSWRSVRVRPQYVAENNVDIEHLRWVHGAKGPIDAVALEEDGCILRIKNRIVYGYGKRGTRLTPSGPIEVEVTAELWGLGFQYTFFPVPDEAVSIQAQTPVDESHCDMFQSVLVYRGENVNSCDPPGALAAARVREQFVQIERDFPIWEHMVYLTEPALTPAEAAAIGSLRAWAVRFYSDGNI